MVAQPMRQACHITLKTTIFPERSCSAGGLSTTIIYLDVGFDDQALAGGSMAFQRPRTRTSTVWTFHWEAGRLAY